MKRVRSLLIQFVLMVAVVAALSPIAAVADTFLGFNPGNSDAPYGIVDLEPHLQSAAYDYCRFGNQMDEEFDTDGDVSLKFTWLTERDPLAATPPYSSALFLRGSLGGMEFLSTPRILSLQRPNLSTRSDGTVTVSTGTGLGYKLMRRLHFPQQLATTSGQVDRYTRKLIILVHGWQPDSDGDAYDAGSGPLADLRDSLATERIATDWKVMTYHWEKDADTGPTSLSGVVNATRAAEIARWHGYHLGQQLDSLSEQQLNGSTSLLTARARGLPAARRVIYSVQGRYILRPSP